MCAETKQSIDEKKVQQKPARIADQMVLYMYL